MTNWAAQAARLADQVFATFAEPAVYTPPGGSPQAVTVIRRQPSEEVAYGSAGFQGIAWEAELRASQVPQPVPGAALVVGGVNFTVIRSVQDIEGTVFTLSLRPA